jgi:hypothetical protein
MAEELKSVPPDSVPPVARDAKVRGEQRPPKEAAVEREVAKLADKIHANA